MRRVVAAIFYIVVVLAICSLGIGGVRAYRSVSFTVPRATKATYRDFIGALRVIVTLNATTDARSGLPVLPPASVNVGYRFVLVNLIADVTVTFAIDVTDVYVVAFSINGTNKSFFLNETATVLQLQRNNLFVGTNQTVLPFTGNYNSLGNRSNIELGRNPLQLAITNLQHNVNVGRQLVVVIQMVSEAARFKHIEQAVLNSIPAEVNGVENPFIPGRLILSMENEWGTMSTKVLGMNATGQFDGSVQLKYDNGTALQVADFNTLLRYTMIAILKRKSGTLTLPLPLPLP